VGIATENPNVLRENGQLPHALWSRAGALYI
jgi:hypothetical protein